MSSFQIKIVGDFCNLRCTYCRNRDFDQASKVVMSPTTLGNLHKFLASSPHPNVRVNWHGGEPLLAGLGFFKKIPALQAMYPDKTWVNAVQTNATLLNNKWANFFCHHGFMVSVSMDGTEETHNTCRRNVGGSGSYTDVMRGVETLRRYSVDPPAICTVTKKTAHAAKEMLQGLVAAGIKNIAFNAFYNTASCHESDEYGLNSDEWARFLINVFEAWLALGDPQVRIREIDGVLAWTLGKSPKSCVFKGACHQWFAINYDGEINPCERHGKEISFGNVNRGITYAELSAHPQLTRWKLETTRIPTKCKNCRVKDLCNNGCSSHRVPDQGGVPLYVYCDSRLGLYEHITRRLPAGRR